MNLAMALGTQRYEIMLNGVGFVKVYVMKRESCIIPFILPETQLAGKIVSFVN